VQGALSLTFGRLAWRPMPASSCPLCGFELRVPEHLAGRLMVCPGCGELVPGPRPDGERGLPRALAAPPGTERHRLTAALHSAAHEQSEPPPEPPFPVPARLGVASLVLGLASILILCVPIVGYAAVGLSALGLLLGLGGLGGVLAGYGAGRPVLPRNPSASVHFGERVRDFPLAGIAACLLALGLALLPFVGR
jgi:hypothetical protein